jgi:uncharacterized protein YheU (UPF0270 family)
MHDPESPSESRRNQAGSRTADTDEEPVEVPHDRIAPTTLRALAEEFVTRDGTDYGATEKTLEQKVAGLMKQLEQGHAKVFYEAKTDTINIVAKQQI